MALCLEERLRQSNARFLASIEGILERYNHPFEDDLLISMQTLSYNTPDGPKYWGKLSTKQVKKWKKEVFEHNEGSQRNADEESDADIVSVRRKFGDIHFENLYADDGQIQEKEKVQVDVTVQDHARGIPLDVIVQDHARKIPLDVIVQDHAMEIPMDVIVQDHARKIPLDVIVQDHAMEVPMDVIVQDRAREIPLDVIVQDHAMKIPVDVIVQDRARGIPKWITIAPCSLKSRSSPVQKLIGNRAAVCRKKVKSNECSSSRLPRLKMSLNAIAKPRHRPSSETDDICDDSILEKYQSADEECSWNNLTLADMYPAMVEILRRVMTKVSCRKELKYMFGYLRHKRWHSRRPKLNVTVNKGRGRKPLKLKQGVLSICSSRSEDIQNQTFRSENRKRHDDKCSTGNLSGLTPCSYIDTNEINMDYSDSSLELDLLSGKGQEVSKHIVSPKIMARMGETFIVEDEVQTTVSLKNSKCKESEKLPYKCSSEYSFITSSASSESTALDLVKESKAQKTDFACSDTSGLCSSACSSYRNSNTSALVMNSSLARVPNTSLVKPDQIIFERQLAFQGKHSLSSLYTSPSQMHQKHEDAFDKLYNRLCSQEIQRPLTPRPLSNSQNLEKRGLVKRTLSYPMKSDINYDREFDRIYEQLCSEAVPKLPEIQRASNLRKYEETQMSETVNALVNSPVRTLSAMPRAKRLGNDFTCSPVKRLKNIPEQYFVSPKRQQISQRKNVNLQTVGMDFLSTYNGSDPSFFDNHSCQSQNFGFHASSDERVLSAPGTSLQESGIAGPHSGWPREMKNYTSPGNAQKCHRRVSRKLSYTGGKDQNPSKTSDNFLVASHQGTFVNCYRRNSVL